MQRLKVTLSSPFEAGNEATGKNDLRLWPLLEEGLQKFAIFIPGFKWTVMKDKVE